MSHDASFSEFIRRIRAGDEQAAAELFRQYEPLIRREVRVRLRLSDGRLRRLFDSSDICQSVLVSFFVRAAAGQFDLEQPENLVKLLVGMVRNKLAFQARKQRAQRRDYRRHEAITPDEWEGAAAGPSPSAQVAGEELLQEVRRRLTEEERLLMDLHKQGRKWAEIAADVGGTPQGRRKQYERAIDRVARQLGLVEVDDG
jgi:RNA polymerase sigma-70 factor (ECF subfamily)